MIAINNAINFGVSLADHTSKCILREKLVDNKQTLLLTMDISQYLHIKSIFKYSYVFPLGLFSKGCVEIEDPYKRTEKCYRSCFLKIKMCIDELF